MRRILLFFVFFIPFTFINAQPTIGLITNSGQSKEGYVLFAPLESKNTYLIDKCGKLVHKWRSKHKPGQSVYLLPDGNLLRTANDSLTAFAGDGGKIEKLDWNSKVLWSCRIATPTQRRHHDICALPNGNILVIVWDKKDMEESVAAGRNPELLENGLWGEKIIEIKPLGKDSFSVVWEWKAWDHLIQEFNPQFDNFGVVGENPQLLNINFATLKSADWLHFNSISYNAKLDQILISIRNYGEFFIIDHSTTTAEAASHSGGKRNKGGDLLYRWGNPAAYNQGNLETQTLFSQHNAHWISEGLQDQGKIMVFNNGPSRPQGEYSSVEIIDPPMDENDNYIREKDQAYAPKMSEWSYTDSIPSRFYSRNISGAQRLSNGNTLICEGAHGRFFEIDTHMRIVWKYVNPIGSKGPLSQGIEKIKQNHVFRCTLYEASYPGLKGKNLKPGAPLELNPVKYNCFPNGQTLEPKR